MECRFDLDTRCNYRCRYCSNFIDSEQYHGPFPVDQLDNAFGCMSRLAWSIYLSCAGEPLVYPHFETAMRKADEHFRGKDVSLVTNGFLLNEKNRGLILNSCITRLFVSVDTASPELYEQLCGTGTQAFQRVAENVRSVIEARGRDRFPKVILIALAMNSTVPRFMELAQWAAAAGVDGIRIHWLVTSDPDLRKTELIRKKRAYPAFSQMKRYLTPRGVHLDYPFGSTKEKLASVVSGSRLVKNKVHYFEAFFTKWQNTLRKNGCRGLGTVIDITIDGSVYCCPGKALKAGNVFSDDSEKIKKSIRNFIEMHRTGKLNECRECGFQQRFD